MASHGHGREFHMQDAAKLSDARKREIARRHADAVRRAVLAERHARDVMRGAVQRATDRLVSETATIQTENAAQHKRRVLVAIAAAGRQLQHDFDVATAEGRAHARELALGQVQLEVVEIDRWVRATGTGDPVPLIQPADEGELDAVNAHQAAGSMAAAWSRTAMGAYLAWRKTGAANDTLPRQLAAVPRLADRRVNVHAITQAHDAYADERAAFWQRAIRPKALRLEDRAARALQSGLAGGGAGGTGPEKGLPYGWQQVVYDVWTAVLDRRTCPICFEADGAMVPVGRPFPGYGRPQVHPSCRCETITLVVPEFAEKRLPGAQLDYGALKADLRDYMRGAQIGELLGARHAQGFLRETIAPSGSSPVSLSRRVVHREHITLGKRGPRAPSLGWPRLPQP